MAIALVTQAILAARLEQLIDRKAKISRVSNRDYEEMFKGKATTEVIIRKFSNVETQHGLAKNAGGIITETDLEVQDESYELTELEQLNVRIKDVNKEINDFNQQDSTTKRLIYRTALNHDSFVAALAVRNAGTTLHNQNPKSYTKTDVEALYADLQTALRNGDIEESNQAMFINAAILSLSNQAPMSTGFDKSLAIKEVFNAQNLSGFMGNWSNNLPIKYTLTIGGAAASTKTITFKIPNAIETSNFGEPKYDEVVWKAVATPTAEGDFKIVSTGTPQEIREAQQKIIEDMINGTGAGDGTDYKEYTTDKTKRAAMRRGFVNCETFGVVNADKAGITARAGVIVSTTMTTPNLLSARSVLIIAMDPKAVHFGELMKSFKIVGTESNNQSFSDNLMWEHTYGGKVTTENRARIAVAEITNGAAESSGA